MIIGRRQQEAYDFIATWDHVWTADVARRLGVSQQAAAQLVKKLEHRGLIAKHKRERGTLRAVR